MNKNVIHNGDELLKGQECPEKHIDAMIAQGHAEPGIPSVTAEKKLSPLAAPVNTKPESKKR